MEPNMELNLSGVGELIAEAKGSLAKYKEKKTYDEAAYNEILEKYESAVKTIELLKTELENQLNKSKLPSKEDVESIEAMLNLMGIKTLDKEGIKKIQALGELGKNDC